MSNQTDFKWELFSPVYKLHFTHTNLPYQWTFGGSRLGQSSFWDFFFKYKILISTFFLSVNGRGGKMNKKKVADKSGYASNIELEEERTRVF